MNKILSAAAATLIAVTSIVASTAPASAGGGITFGFGGGGYGPYGGPWYGGPYGGGVYVDVGPGYGPGPGYGGSWKKHVKWCLSHYKSYNPDTNLFKTKWGYQECDSPWY